MGRFTSLLKLDRFGGKEMDKEKQVLLETSHNNPPKDWFMLTYIILFVHGVGHLLPWNMFITAHDYFESRFKINNTCQHNLLCEQFESFFSVAAMLPVLITNVANVYIQSRVHFKWRMLSALVVMLLLFSLTTALVPFDTSEWVAGFFTVTIITITILNLSSGLFQSSTFGFAGILPRKYTSIVMVGQACAGIFSAVVRIITSLAAPDGKGTNRKHWDALGYFMSAVIVIGICLFSFFILMKLKFTQYYMEQTTVTAIKVKQEASIKASVNIKTSQQLPFWSIFRQVFVCSISVFIVFTVTISLFPAIISSINSTVAYPNASIWTGKLFDAVVCFLLFNCSDLVGRFLSAYVELKGRWQLLLLFGSIVRILFIPLFLFCNVQRRSFPVYFHSDIIPVVLTVVLGLTNGFAASVAMVSVPHNLKPEHRETGAIIAASFLALGLLVGAGFSFLFKPLVTWF